MANYLTIDGGTTNTRISLIMENKIVDTLKFNVGARNSVDNKFVLRDTIRDGISQILTKNALTENDITRILAAGMITSEYGLFNLDHGLVPAGQKELHGYTYEVLLNNVSNIPFVFVRGLKLKGASIDDTDMMRGEESEFMGLYSGEGVYILSGSHTKIIKADSSGKIVDFKTMLTGEMIAVLSQNTILKDAVELKSHTLDKDFLLEGYTFAKNNGLNSTLFKVRVLKNVYKKSASEIYSFYLGAVLCDEIQYVLSLKTEQIVVSGQSQIKEAVTELLRQLSDTKVVSVSAEKSDGATAIGMMKIYEFAE